MWLFRHADRAAFSRDDVAKMVKRLMQGIGLDPAFFGAHSLRIGGATAALAAGISPSLIRVMGRWSSDIYHIYCRLSAEAAAGDRCAAQCERGSSTCGWVRWRRRTRRRRPSSGTAMGRPSAGKTSPRW